MKVGIIRCQRAEVLCPGTGCFRVSREGKGAFEETGPVEIVGFVTCGGCPGKEAVQRAKLMINKGAEAIVLASCISRGKPINFPCPFFEEIKAAVNRALPDIKIIDYTH